MINDEEWWRSTNTQRDLLEVFRDDVKKTYDVYNNIIKYLTTIIITHQQYIKLVLV